MNAGGEGVELGTTDGKSGFRSHPDAGHVLTFSTECGHRGKDSRPRFKPSDSYLSSAGGFTLTHFNPLRP